MIPSFVFIVLALCGVALGARVYALGQRDGWSRAIRLRASLLAPTAPPPGGTWSEGYNEGYEHGYADKCAGKPRCRVAGSKPSE